MAVPVVHSLAQVGFGVGTNELYNRARPTYQSFALSYIRQGVQTSPMNIVEVGAGTGIFTRALLSHPEWSPEIKEIKAIEPSPGMREVFSKTVQSDHVTISIADGTFERTGVEDQWADIIVVAQAFHWCPDYERASAEFARILKPGGLVALIWNLEDRDRAQWVAQLRNRIEEHEAGTPQFRLNLWRQTFETPSYQKLFQNPIEKIWPYSIPTTLDITVDRVSSKSYIAVLPAEAKAAVKADVKAIVERGEGKVWIDENNGTFKYPYKCFVVLAYSKD